MDAYRDDLAFVHESGFAHLAHGAAQTLLQQIVPASAARNRVVDLGCGGGTLAAQLIAGGYDVLGYDLSPAMIRLARARAPKATFHCGSFVDAEFPECIAVTAIGEVFNYLFDQRNDGPTFTGVLQRIHSALRPGGILLFDTAGPERASVAPTQRYFDRPDWTVLVTASKNNHVLTRQIVTIRRVGESYRRSEETHRLRLVDAGFVEQTLASIGFETDRFDHYGDVELPPGLHVFLARKPRAASP